MTMPTFEPVVLVDDRCAERLNWYAKFEHTIPDGTKLHPADQLTAAFEAGKQAAQVEQEPVGRFWHNGKGKWVQDTEECRIKGITQPLYAAPPAPAVPDGVPMHAEIHVGDGRFAICDWADFDTIKAYNWCLTTRNRSGCIYAQSWDHGTAETRKRVSMHGLIAKPGAGLVVDHINGNGLDNRRANLRVVTVQQNAFNQKSHGGSSSFKGVSFDIECGLWRAYITVSGKRKYLGRHGTEIEAAKAYDMAARELHGDFAKLNEA